MTFWLLRSGGNIKGKGCPSKRFYAVFKATSMLKSINIREPLNLEKAEHSDSEKLFTVFFGTPCRCGLCGAEGTWCMNSVMIALTLQAEAPTGGSHSLLSPPPLPLSIITMGTNWSPRHTQSWVDQSDLRELYRTEFDVIYFHIQLLCQNRTPKRD